MPSMIFSLSLYLLQSFAEIMFRYVMLQQIQKKKNQHDQD